MTQAEQLAAQAAQWQAAGRADMAIQLYAAALEHDPSKFAIRMQLAECLAGFGQVDAAAEHHLLVAQAYAARGRQQECLAICDRVLAIAPHTFVYMTVGPMVRRIGRQARPVCARAAEVHLAAGRQTDGLQMLRLGAELDPHNPDVRRQLARIYQSRHMKREAVEALADAGNLLLQAKRHDDYVAVAEQILALEPRDLDTLRDLPRVYLELRRPHDAVRTLGQLTKASPGDIVGYEILAQAFAMIGRVDKALSVLERLVEELGATGRADKADAILNHARYWRPTDVGFMRSLKRMEIPRPAAPPERSGPRVAAPEGTVVLSIADLLVDEGSRRAPVPGSGDVQLTEVEGTLTLRLDDLVLDEMQQAAGKGVAPTKPPLGGPPPPPARRGPLPPPPPRRVPSAGADVARGPRRMLEPSADATMPLDAGGGTRRRPDATVALEAGGGPPRPAEAQVDATMALDAADLIEALTGASTHASVDEERTTVPPPSRRPAVERSMSDLIYDDDDGEGEVDARQIGLRQDGVRAAETLRDEDEPEAETLLHMKPLTAEDIARALAEQAARAQPAAPTPTPTPTPTMRSSAPAEDEAVTMPPPARTPAEDEAVTMPPPARTPRTGDEAPTVARLTPLSAADIARALSQRSPARPSSPVRDDDITMPPSLGATASPELVPSEPSEPSEPPLLPPNASLMASDEDEGDESTIAMTALRPEDFLLGPHGRRGGPSRT